MDRKESLNDSRWEFKINQEVKSYYDKAKKKSGNRIVLLSNRVRKVETPLRELLSRLGYEFDEYLLIEDDGERSKAKRLLDYLKNINKVENIYYWEDKDKHIKDISENIPEKYGVGVTVHKVT
tara:strand:+ start:1188 stop:1556 length:369 start_codon:yes stop_codon:yes gene_type:complete